MMEQPAVEQIARRLFEAMNDRDFKNVDSIFHEDIRFDFPGIRVAEGPGRTFILINAILMKYPELKFSLKEIIVQEEKCCVVWTNRGIDLDNKPYENRGMTLLHFKEGRIVFISDYFKDTSFTGSHEQG